MKFTITEKKINVSDEIKEYAERKISKIDRFFRGEAEAFVTFSAERGRYKIEITIENSGTFYRDTEVTSDMHASIDSACASIERQIRKYKTRLEKRLREGAFEREVVPELEEEPDDSEFNIVRTKRFPMGHMTVDEAILQMNLLEHQFFAFKNEDDGGAFAVVYRRNNGGYGLICDAE